MRTYVPKIRRDKFKEEHHAKIFPAHGDRVRELLRPSIRASATTFLRRDEKEGLYRRYLGLDREQFRLQARSLYRQDMQLVLMSLRPGEEIGEETHDSIDQFFRIEEGSGEVVINGLTSNVKSDYAIVIPAGARHNIKNTGTTPLRLYTIYAPPEHKDKTIHATKQDAKAKEAHFDGQTSESSD